MFVSIFFPLDLIIQFSCLFDGTLLILSSQTIYGRDGCRILSVDSCRFCDRFYIHLIHFINSTLRNYICNILLMDSIDWFDYYYLIKLVDEWFALKSTILWWQIILWIFNITTGMWIDSLNFVSILFIAIIHFDCSFHYKWNRKNVLVSIPYCSLDWWNARSSSQIRAIK